MNRVMLLVVAVLLAVPSTAAAEAAHASAAAITSVRGCSSRLSLQALLKFGAGKVWLLEVVLAGGVELGGLFPHRTGFSVANGFAIEFDHGYHLLA